MMRWTVHYLTVNHVDVWASRAEVAERPPHTGILHQQEVRTCWTEIHRSPLQRQPAPRRLESHTQAPTRRPIPLLDIHLPSSATHTKRY